MAPPLEAAGHRVLVPYLRGYGPTRFVDPAGPRMAQQAAIGQDLLDFIDALGPPRVIHRRKRYPAVFRDYLSSGLGVQQASDYGRIGVSKKIAQRLFRRAESFVSIVQEATQHGPSS